MYIVAQYQTNIFVLNLENYRQIENTEHIKLQSPIQVNSFCLFVFFKKLKIYKIIVIIEL